MKKTIETVQSLRLEGAPISSSSINAIVKGIVIANDRMLLVENGGHLSFSGSWARNISNEMERNGKKMKRRMTTTCKIPVAPALLEEEKFTFQRNIMTLDDQTVGKEKQEQITGTFTVSADGDLFADAINLCRKNRSLSSKWNKLSRRIQYNPCSKSLEL